MIVVHEVAQGSDEWHKLRAGKYTGNGAHKLLRAAGSTKLVNGTLSAYSINDDSSDFGGNFHTKRGHVLEDEAIGLYEQIVDAPVARPGFITNDKYPMCGYSPDGICQDVLIEVKCFGEPQHKKLLAGDIKLEILAQIHYGLVITELQSAVLLAYNPQMKAIADKLAIIPIKANRQISSNFKRLLAQKVAA